MVLEHFREVKPIIERLSKKYGHQIPTDDVVQICLKALLENSPNLEPGLASVIMESDVKDEVRKLYAQKRDAEFVELSMFLPSRDQTDSSIILQDTIAALYAEFPESAYMICDLLANEGLTHYSSRTIPLVNNNSRLPLRTLFKAHGLTYQRGRSLLDKVKKYLRTQGYRG